MTEPKPEPTAIAKTCAECTGFTRSTECSESTRAWCDSWHIGLSCTKACPFFIRESEQQHV